MKKIKIFLLILIFPNFCFASFIGDLMFKPAITLEYQTSYIDKKNFKRQNIEENLKNFDNMVLGFHLRPSKYIGFNANISKFTMESTDFENQNPEDKSSIKTSIADLSALFFVPVIGDGLVDLFLEAGISDVNYDLKIQEISDLNNIKSHETVFLYGAGMQFDPYLLDAAFRISYQERRTKLSILRSNIKTFRTGIVKYF